MPHYLLAIQQLDGGPLAPEILEPIMRDVAEFNAQLRAAGAWVFAGGLQDPSTAAAVARPDNMVTDGPYIEGKEHVGGLSIITTRDFDFALGMPPAMTVSTPETPVKAVF